MTVLLERTWIDVCGYDDLQPERGARALVGGHHVALFRTHEGEVHAIGDVDPFSGASVLSRGIVGSRGPVPIVTSPMFKQAFDLRTGECLDDPAVSVPVFAVRVEAGRIQVGGP